MDKIFYTESSNLLHIMVSAFLIYMVMIIYFKIAGKRSTSEMNNFDWIVTVAIGSLVASTLILDDVSVTDGALGILMLLFMQYLLTKLMFHSGRVRKAIKSKPSLLLYKGRFIEENLKKERILKSEIYAAIRRQGHKSLSRVYAVVLETNAKLSVIANDEADEVGFTLSDVEGLPDDLIRQLKNKDDA